MQAAANAIAVQDPTIPLNIRGEMEIKGKGTMVRAHFKASTFVYGLPSDLIAVGEIALFDLVLWLWDKIRFIYTFPMFVC